MSDSKKAVARLIEVERQLTDLRPLLKERSDLVSVLLEHGRIFKTRTHDILLRDVFTRSKAFAWKSVCFSRYDVIIVKRSRK